MRRRSRHAIETVALLGTDHLAAACHQASGQRLALTGSLTLKQPGEDLFPDATHIGKLEARTKGLALLKELPQEREEVGMGEVGQRQARTLAGFRTHPCDLTGKRPAIAYTGSQQAELGTSATQSCPPAEGMLRRDGNLRLVTAQALVELVWQQPKGVVGDPLHGGQIEVGPPAEAADEFHTLGQPIPDRAIRRIENGIDG